MLLLLTTLGALGVASSSRGSAPVYRPQQVHLSVSGRHGEMVVDWVDSCPAGTAKVMWASFPFDVWREGVTNRTATRTGTAAA